MCAEAQPPLAGGDTPIQPVDNTPIHGGDTPIQGELVEDAPIHSDDEDLFGDTPIQGGETPIQGGDTPIQGRDTPILAGGDTPIRSGGDTPIQGGDTPIQGGDTLIQSEEDIFDFAAALDSDHCGVVEYMTDTPGDANEPEQHTEDNERQQQKSVSAWQCPRPSERTTADHFALCAKMRESRCKRKLQELSRSQASCVAAYAETVNKNSGMAGAELRVVKARGKSGRASQSSAFGLALTTRRVKGAKCGHQYVLPWSEMIHIAYGKTHDRSSIAEAHVIDRATVRRTIQLAAHIFTDYQIMQLKTVGDIIEMASHRLDFASCCVMWDETGQRVELACAPGTTKSQQRSVWPCLQTKVRFSWGFGEQIYAFEVALPAIPLASNAASHIYGALEHHPMLRDVLAFRRRLFLNAGISSIVHEMDGHMANDKFHFYRLAEVQTENIDRKNVTLVHSMWCHNHQTNLVIVACMGSIAMSLLNDLFCIVKFLKMGGHYLRLAACSRQVANDVVDFVPHPAAGVVGTFADYWREVAAFLIDNYDADHGMAKTERRRSQKAKEAFAERARHAFGVVLNGNPSTRGMIPHYCTSRCQCKSKADAVSLVVDVIVRIMLSQTPCEPEIGKWTKLCPCLQFFWLCGHHDIMGMLLNSASASFRYPVGPQRGEEHAAEDEAPELTWRELAGSRLHRSRRFTADGNKQAHLTMLCIVLEPLRALHLYWLSLGHSCAGESASIGLFEEIWPSHSRVVLTMQYYSSLLAGSGSRLTLIWVRAGCASFSAWVRAFPVMASTLRRLLLCCAAWLERRVAANLRKHWAIFGLGDHRRRAEHDRLINDFFSEPACCKAPGFMRDLRRLHSVADLSRPHWQHFFHGTALSIKMSIASVEKNHARDRRITHAAMPWRLFAAGALNAEVREQWLARQRGRHMQLQPRAAVQQQLERQEVSQGEQMQPTWLRGQSAEQLFRADWLRTQRGLDRKVNACDPHVWDEVRTSFKDLSPERLEHYASESRQSRTIARANRLAKRQRLRQQEQQQHLQGHPERPDEALPEPVAVQDDLVPVAEDNVANVAFLNNSSLAVRHDFAGAQDLSEFHVEPQIPKPLSGKVLAAYMHRDGDSNIFQNVTTSPNRRAIQEAWKAKSETVEPDHGFPQAVRYSCPCGSLCQTSTAERRLKFHAQFTGRLLNFIALASPQKQMGKAMNADAILAIELYGGDGADHLLRTDFCSVAAGSGKQGRHRPGATVVNMKVVHGEAAAIGKHLSADTLGTPIVSPMRSIGAIFPVFWSVVQNVLLLCFIVVLYVLCCVVLCVLRFTTPKQHQQQHNKKNSTQNNSNNNDNNDNNDNKRHTQQTKQTNKTHKNKQTQHKQHTAHTNKHIS